LCIIIDASVAGLFFRVPHDANYAPVWTWIERRDGKIVYGGELAGELNRLGSARRLLVELQRKGRAYLIQATRIQEEEKRVVGMRNRRSDDPHVLALARASGARILCTDDDDLEADFKNVEIVPRPRGKIYKNARHARLLGHNGICVGRRR
jgi:predicted nucleic acid-binding protein